MIKVGSMIENADHGGPTWLIGIVIKIGACESCDRECIDWGCSGPITIDLDGREFFVGCPTRFNKFLVKLCKNKMSEHIKRLT